MASPRRNYHRGMVIAAHADDAEFSCGGTVAKWCREGTEVVYVICTDGSKGSDDPDMNSERLAAIREQEQLNAAQVLGVSEVVFLHHPDAYLQPTLELRQEITREIRRFKPEVVICPSPVRTLQIRGYIGHPDHIAVGEAAVSAVFPSARDRLTFPELLEDGLEPHKVRDLLIAGELAPDTWVDVSAEMERLIMALQQHVSQHNGFAVGWEDSVYRSRREVAGSQAGIQYAEAYRKFVLD